LRDQLADGLKTVLCRDGHRSPRGVRRSSPNNTIWALKNVSFEINQGEVVRFHSELTGRENIYLNGAILV